MLAFLQTPTDYANGAQAIHHRGFCKACYDMTGSENVRQSENESNAPRLGAGEVDNRDHLDSSTRNLPKSEEPAKASTVIWCVAPRRFKQLKRLIEKNQKIGGNRQ